MEADCVYAPKDLYVWDFWLVHHQDQWHMFHLQAPRRWHPEARHFQATVGHAVSTDLVNWRYLGTALEPGPEGAWDDRCIWTGSIIRHEDRFRFLYTALNRREFLVQRIGLAESDDLIHWTRHPANPVLTADRRWYQTAPGKGRLAVEDWRDPYLCLIDGQPTAFITARTPIPPGASRSRIAGEFLLEALRSFSPIPLGYPSGPFAGRGCIARATSSDFVNWTVHPPAFAPGNFSALECPQYFQHERRHYLTFSTMRAWYARSWARRCGGGQTGVHAWQAPTAYGPWRPVNGNGVVLGSSSHRYATRFINGPDNGWRAISWRIRAREQRGFAGCIDQPKSVRFEEESLTVGSDWRD